MLSGGATGTGAGAPGGGRGRSGALKLALTLGLLNSFGPLSIDMYLPQLPELAARLQTSDALAQATMSVCLIGLGIGQLVAGPLSDRFGRKRPVVLGVLLFAVFSFACAIAPSIELLLAARFLQGLAGAAGVVISMAIARDLFEGAELSRMLSLLTLVTFTMPIIAPVIGGLLSNVTDWRGIFVVLGGIGIALTLLAILGVRETLSTSLRHDGPLFGGTAAHLGAVFRDPLFMAVFAASCLGGLAFFSYLSMSSFVLQDELGLTPQLFSMLFAMNALAELGGAQLSRLLVRRFGPRRMYLAGQVSGAATGLLLLGATLAGAPPWLFLAFLALFLAGIGISGPNGTVLALTSHGGRAGTASAMMGMAMFTFGGLGTPVIAELVGTTALTMASVLAAGTVLAAVIALTIVRRLAPRH